MLQFLLALKYSFLIEVDNFYLYKKNLLEKANQIQILVQYKFDNGFGVQANVVMWGEMNSGYEGYQAVVRNPDDPSGASDYTVTASTARAPIQYEIDAKIFYEYESWRFELSAFNITDEENWDFNNSLYANGSAVARPDTTYQFLVSYEW